MEVKEAITATLKETVNLYKFSFKVCFVFSLALSVLTEYFKIYAINLGLYDALKQYFESGNIPEHLQNNTLLGFLGILSIVATIVVYGLLVCLGEMQFKNKTAAIKKFEIYKALSIFKGRFWPFFGVFFINVILSGLAGFLGVIGIWLITSFSFIVFPLILLSNLGVFQAYKRTFVVMGKNAVYAIQVGFIAVILLGIKYLIYFIFIAINDYDNIHFGIEHAVMVFIEALTLPFVTMLMISVYHRLSDNGALLLKDETPEHR